MIRNTELQALSATGGRNAPSARADVIPRRYENSKAVFCLVQKTPPKVVFCTKRQLP
jgi:hypothetical protein